MERERSLMPAPHRSGLTAKGRGRAALASMNTHIFGGQGKTTLLIHQCLDALRDGGALFVDPGGAASDTLLSLCPKRPVLVIDPTDVSYPVGFNVLYDVRNKPLLASLLLSTVKAIWHYDRIATPVLDRTLYNTLAALLEYPGATLLHIEPMLTDKRFREHVLDHVSDPVLLRKWAYWSRKKPKDWDQLIASTENKAGEFSEDPRIRHIVGQASTTFDLRRLMFDRALIVLRLPRGELGQKTAMFGSLFLAHLLATAYERRGIFPFHVFIDDVQHFDTPVVRELLAAARRHNLHVTATNQYLAQLSDELTSALIGTCERRIMFRCGIEDSAFLHRTLPEDNTKPKLHQLGRFEAIVFKGENTDRIETIKTKSLPVGQTKRRKTLVEQSRRSYGRDSGKVEEAVTRSLGE